MHIFWKGKHPEYVNSIFWSDRESSVFYTICRSIIYESGKGCESRSISIGGGRGTQPFSFLRSEPLALGHLVSALYTLDCLELITAFFSHLRQL